MLVTLSPKALRFVRLAAEQQASFSGDPRVLDIRHREEMFGYRDIGGVLPQYVEVSKNEATFCLQVITTLLKNATAFATDWDANDFTFMQAVIESLREQLE